MNRIGRTFRRFLPCLNGPRDYENAIIDSIESLVSEPTRSVIRSQWQSIEFVQRIANDKEATFYPPRYRLAVDAPLLPRYFPEWPLAVVHVSSLDGAEPIRATVWVVEGRIFSILFRRSPTVIRTNRFAISRSQLIMDPSEYDSDIHEPASQSSQDRFKIGHLDISVRSPPLTQNLRVQLLEVAANSVPPDYCELMAQTNDCKIGNWRIAGLPLREIAMEPSNLFILAESNDQPKVLCAMDGDVARRTHMWDLEDDREVPVEGTFASIVADGA